MKIGIALSGGGIRGIAHAGVLKALEEENIKVDIIGGTSAGSMVASLYAIGYTPDEIYMNFKSNSSRILGSSKFNFVGGIKNKFNKGFRNGKKIEEVFKELANKRKIEKINEIKMPIVIPTVDINDSKEYVFTNNIPTENENNKYISDISVGEAIRASSSFPAVFDVCNIKKHIFIDGGALNNIPVGEVKKQGADKLIAVRFRGDKINENSNIFDIVMRTIDIMGNKIIEQDLLVSDYVLDIDITNIGLFDINELDNCYNHGYMAMKNKLSEIKEILEK